MPRLLLVVLSILALALSACGGDDLSSKSAPDIVKETFGPGKSVKSGVVDLRVSLDATLPGTEGPLKLALKGPFSSVGAAKLPRFDFDATVDAGGQSITAGALSTGDKGFLSFLGQNFAVDAATFAEFKKLYEDDQKKAADQKDDAPSFSTLGITPSSWLKGAKKAGEESVGGAETVHVTAGVDVPKLLDDVNKLLGRADATGAAAATGATGAVPTELTPEQRETIEQSVKRTSFDLYSGKDDGTLRRINVQVAFDVPKDRQGAAGGLTKGTFGLDLVISELNEEQEVKAPTGAKPLSELLGSGATGATGATAPEAGSAEPPSAYEQCQDEATSVADLQKCAPLFNG